MRKEKVEKLPTGRARTLKELESVINIKDQVGEPEDWETPMAIKEDGPAKTEYLGTSASQVPYEALYQLGLIFREGMAKYGRDNWKKGVGDKGYQEERREHAIRHLILAANGDTSENHIAKVGWYAVTQLWIEAEERRLKANG